MFQPLKLINFKPISSGFFIFFRFMSGVGCVGCFFARAFLCCLPAKLCTSHKSVAYLLVFQRECLFARSWPVSLRLFAYLNAIHKCPLIILNIATFIVCSTIWSLKKVVVTAQSIPHVPIPDAHLSFFFSFLKPKNAPLYWYCFSLFRSCYPSQGRLCNNFVVR